MTGSGEIDIRDQGVIFFGPLSRERLQSSPTPSQGVYATRDERPNRSRPLTAVLFLSGIADAAGVLAATPTAKSSQSSTLRKVQLSRGAATPAAANPLRSTPPLEFPKPAPTAKASQSADRASTTALRAASAAKKPFVPNTGRLQIFRAAEKPIASTLKNGDVHRLFPKGAGTKVQANAIPMMRYEDVARGAALVPITPRANSRPTTSTKMQTPTTTADSTIAPKSTHRSGVCRHWIARRRGRGCRRA